MFWFKILRLFFLNFFGIMKLIIFVVEIIKNLLKMEDNFMKIRTKMISRKLLAYVLTVAMVFSVLVSVAISVNAADGYQLVWSDEFDGNGVNPYNWSLDTGVRNGERQTYTIDNAKTQNGKLIIKGECTVVDKNGNVMPDGQVSNHTMP